MTTSTTRSIADRARGQSGIRRTGLSAVARRRGTPGRLVERRVGMGWKDADLGIPARIYL